MACKHEFAVDAACDRCGIMLSELVHDLTAALAEREGKRDDERRQRHLVASERDDADLALFKCYTYTGAEAGDEDDFRALVNKYEAVPDAVMELRERGDAAEARVKELEAAVEWVLNDALYKAPEQIGVVPERWIDRLKEARAGKEGK
jgi:hypothetical protein